MKALAAIALLAPLASASGAELADLTRKLKPISLPLTLTTAEAPDRLDPELAAALVQPTLGEEANDYFAIGKLDFGRGVVATVVGAEGLYNTFQRVVLITWGSDGKPIEHLVLPVLESGAERFSAT